MRRAAVVLLLVLAGGGFFGGINFVVSPDGSSMGLDAELVPAWLPGDYLVPGVVLLTVFGVMPVMAALLWRFRILRAAQATVFLGASLVTWMVIQFALIGLIAPPMQLTFTAIGAALACLGIVELRRAKARRTSSA